MFFPINFRANGLCHLGIQSLQIYFQTNSLSNGSEPASKVFQVQLVSGGVKDDGACIRLRDQTLGPMSHLAALDRLFYASKALKSKVALVPPNPNELDMAALTLAFLASLGT